MDRIVPGIFCKRPCGVIGRWTQGYHIIPLSCVGYLLLEWLCFISVRLETIARIKNNRIFIFILGKTSGRILGRTWGVTMGKTWLIISI